MARVFLQSPDLKAAHRGYVAAKVAAARAGYLAGVRRSVPVLGALAAPFAGLAWDLGQAELSRRGARGEGAVGARLARLLPGSWVLMPDCCVSFRGRHAQVDLVAVGPPGVALVEVKAWRGDFWVSGEVWWRRSGSSWVACRSPAYQVLRAARLMAGLLRSVPGVSASLLVCPAVVFTGGRVWGAGSPVPVYADPAVLARDLLRLPGVLDAPGVERVLGLLGARGC